MARVGAWSAVIAAVLATASVAHAGEDEVDTSYGRVDGDLAAELGAGATFGPRSPRAAIDLRLRYLSTAGLFATYEDGPLVGSTTEPRRAFAFGIEVRPLFLARWVKGRETGVAFVDLTIDSFALELGAVFAEPVGSAFGSRPGLQAGLGLELPVLPNVSGPLVGIHGGTRWSDAALAGRSIEGPSDRSLYLLVTLAWQQAFKGHVVGLGDRAPR